MAADPLLRVSSAAICRVIFPHPQTGVMLLALERAAHANRAVRLQAHPFGGALRILDPAAFRQAVGDFTYDSLRSRDEQDLRIVIPPAAWVPVRELILAQFHSQQPDVIETDPCRELEEEFMESVGITLFPEHYSYRPIGISVQDQPVPTTSSRSPGSSTVRIYRIFEVVILDSEVRRALLENSQRFTDEELQAAAEADAARGGKGRANAALVLPLDEVRRAYQAVSPHADAQSLLVHDHQLDSVSAVLFPELFANLPDI